MMTAITARFVTTRFNWRMLLQVAAAVDLILLLTITIALRDLLSLALLLIILAGLALWRFRGGLAGVIILALVFADITAYTLTGTVSNIRYHEELLALVLPASLAATSLAGVIAAVAVGLRRRRPDAGEKAARIVGLAAVAFFSFVLLAGLVAGPGSQPASTAQHTDLALQTENMVYSSTELVADAGQITVSLANQDLFWHTFTIDELDVDLQTPVRGERQVTFTARPGMYSFYCAIPGHAAIGMRGTLTVRQGGSFTIHHSGVRSERFTIHN